MASLDAADAGREAAGVGSRVHGSVGAVDLQARASMRCQVVARTGIMGVPLRPCAATLRPLRGIACMPD